MALHTSVLMYSAAKCTGQLCVTLLLDETNQNQLPFEHHFVSQRAELWKSTSIHQIPVSVSQKTIRSVEEAGLAYPFQFQYQGPILVVL